MSTDQEPREHFVDPAQTRTISREEWGFQQRVAEEQAKRQQYPGYTVLDTDNQRGH